MTKKKSSERLTRRRFLKSSAVATGTAATLGTADSLGFSLVEDADAAVATTTAIVAVGGSAIAAGAGVALIDYALDTNDVDQEDLEYSIYNAATAAAQNRDVFEAEIKSQYDDVKPQQTPYADAAWSTVRSEVVGARSDGASKAEAQSRALKALDKQTTRAVVNMVEKHNVALTSLKAHIIADNDNGVGVFYGLHDPSGEDIVGRTGGTVNPVDGTGNLLYKFTTDEMDLPASVDDLEGRSGPMTVWGFGTSHPSGPDRFGVSHPLNGGTFGAPDTHNPHSSFSANITDMPEVTVVDSQLYWTCIGRIESAYSSIKSDLSTYIDNIYAGIEQGGIEAEEILGPEDLYENFSTSDDQKRVAAELTAVGADVPDELDMQVLISHESLAVDELWVDLYPMLTDQGKQKTIQPGTTLQTGDFELAVIGYHSADTGEYKTDLLKDNNPIQILDVDNVEGQAAGNTSEGVGPNGEITVWDTDADGDAPEGLTSADTSIVVESGDARSTHTGDELTQDSGVYTLPSTALSEGQSLDAVRIVPAPTYSQPTKHVADPTAPDPEVTKQQVKQYNELADKIDGMNSTGAGFLPDFGGVPSWVVAAGVGFIGYLALGHDLE